VIRLMLTLSEVEVLLRALDLAAVTELLRNRRERGLVSPADTAERKLRVAVGRS
jgi:hypothetical protein